MYAHGIGRIPADPCGAADTGPTGLVPWHQVRPERITRQERREVRPHGDGSDARPTATVGDAERLVQVEVADVGTEPPRLGDADQRVEVGAVDVDLAAGGVHEVAQLGDRRLEHTVGGRVRHHDRGQTVTGRGQLRPQVVEVDVARIVGRDDRDVEPCHHGAGGVGAVGARRDEADRAVVVASRAVIGADRQQARQLALTAGVGLHADGVVPGDLGQRGLQLGDQRPHARPTDRPVRTGAGSRTRAT